MKNVRSLLVLFLAIAAIAAIAGPVAARKPLALGISKSNGGESTAALDAFTASNGGVAPALWTLRSKWGDPANKHFPTTAANDLHARGVTPLIWWTPLAPATWEQGKFERYKRIVKGKHDTYIRNWARAARDYGHPFVLRFAHEPNVSFFPWAVGRFDNTTKNYKQAWRYIWNIFQEEDADNVSFLWSLAKKSCGGCNPYKKFYPGDKYVDYVGFSAFNWGGYRGRRWVGMIKSYTQPMKKFKEFTSKPVIVPETASHFKNGNKAKWIANGYKKVYNTWSRLVAIVYLDSNAPHIENGHPDWRLKKPKNGSARAAYATMSAKARNQGSIP